MSNRTRWSPETRRARYAGSRSWSAIPGFSRSRTRGARPSTADGSSVGRAGRSPDVSTRTQASQPAPDRVPSMALPVINALVDIVLLDGEVFESRVEDVEGRVL